MIRELAKATVCQALALTRIEAWLERRVPVVIGYHQVVDRLPIDDVMPGLAIAADMFAHHLDAIGRRCRFVTLDELAAALASGRAAQSLCAVTFDDGYAGVHHHALPVLRAKGVPAAVFVVPGVVAAPLLHDRLYRTLATRDRDRAYDTARMLIEQLAPDELERLVDRLDAELPLGPSSDAARTLSWDEIDALRTAGITIGSHTSSHARLVGLAPDQLSSELAGSRRALEQRLGEPVHHFAYPDGAFDADAVSAVESAGYRYAYTICQHRDRARPQLTIPRTMLWQQSSLGASGRFSRAVLDCQVHGRLPFFDPCRREHVRA